MKSREVAAGFVPELRPREDTERPQEDIEEFPITPEAALQERHAESSSGSDVPEAGDAARTQCHELVLDLWSAKGVLTLLP